MASYLDYEYQKYLNTQELKNKPWSYSTFQGGMNVGDIITDYKSRPSHILNGIQFGSGLASDESRKFNTVQEALWGLGIDPNASRDAINWRISEILSPNSAWATRSNIGIDFTTPDFKAFSNKYGTDPSKWTNQTLQSFYNELGNAGINTYQSIKDAKAASQSFGAIFGNIMKAISPGLIGAGIAGFPGIPGLAGSNSLTGGIRNIVSNITGGSGGSGITYTPVGSIGQSLTGSGIIPGAANNLPALGNLVPATGGGSMNILQNISNLLSGGSGTGTSPINSVNQLFRGINNIIGTNQVDNFQDDTIGLINSQAGFHPPVSYRDNLLQDLNLILDNPQKYMDTRYKGVNAFVGNAAQRNMVAQGYGGAGDSGNTNFAMSDAILKNMSTILNNDFQALSNGLAPWYQTGSNAANLMANYTVTPTDMYNAQGIGDAIQGGFRTVSNILDMFS